MLEIIKNMMCENTGKNLLDSGDVYGRHYEENQNGIMTGPQKVDFWTDGKKETELIPIVPLYDFLTYNLEVDGDSERLEDEFYNYIKVNNLDPYSVVDIEDTIKAIGEEESTYGKIEMINTYNYECHLSQTIQFTLFSDGYSNTYVCLQIHNGCDARAGYTLPKIFYLEEPEYFMSGTTDALITCGCRNYNYYDYDYIEVYDGEDYIGVDNEYIFNHTYVDDNGDLRCKDCGELLMSECMEY